MTNRDSKSWYWMVLYIALYWEKVCGLISSSFSSSSTSTSSFLIIIIINNNHNIIFTL